MATATDGCCSWKIRPMRSSRDRRTANWLPMQRRHQLVPYLLAAQKELMELLKEKGVITDQEAKRGDLLLDQREGRKARKAVFDRADEKTPLTAVRLLKVDDAAAFWK